MTSSAKKSLFYQQDQADCGIACLMMILKYHNKYKSFEELRYLSGTTKDGTTLLGLYQCANKIGFIAEGCKGNIRELEKSSNPIILRVLIDELLHYVVCFYYDKKSKRYIIGDPSRGLLKLSKEELETLWKDRFCLTMLPNNNGEICNINDYQKDKKSYLLGLITQDKRILLHGVFFSLVISILGLSSSVYSQQLVDHILPSQNLNKIIWSIVILGILLTVRIALNYIKDTLFNYQSKLFNNRIANSFYTELLYLPKLFFNTRKVGDLVARLNDTAKVQSVIHLFFNNYINDFLTIIIATILIFYYYSTMGMITVCFIPLLAYLIIQRSKIIIHKQRDVQIYYALTEANYISTITGISDIKNLNKEKYFSVHNSRLFEAYQSKRFSLARIYINLNVIISILSTIFFIITISMSIYSIRIDKLSIGDLIALLSISGLIISSTSNLSLLFIPYTEARISFERMYNIINIKKKTNNKKENKTEKIKLIKIENITFTYPGVARKLYVNSWLTLKEGTITVLTGNCGSGKTTLIDILLGNYPVDKGKVIYNDNDISTIDRTYTQRKIRVVPQNIHIFNGSILFNIAMNETFDINKMNTLFDKLNILSFFEIFPQNFNTIIGEEGISLSGGQKQIIGLLRALYDEPEVLILDEPIASLDTEYRKLLCQSLERIKPNYITLLISHDISVFTTIIDKRYKIENAQIIEII